MYLSSPLTLGRASSEGRMALPPPSPMPRNGANTAPVTWVLVVAFAVVAPVAPVAMVLSAGRPLDAPSRTLSAARGRAELTASFPTWRPKPMPMS